MGRDVVEARADRGDQLGRDGRRQNDRGTGRGDRDGQRRRTRQLLQGQRDVDVAVGIGRGRGVLLADQRAQRGLLLAGQPAELAEVRVEGRELAAASLHESQYLEHPVVHGAGQPGPFLAGDRLPLGRVALTRHQLERLAHEAHDRTADHEQEHVPVVALADVAPDRQVGRREQHTGDEATAPVPVDRPREQCRHHPEAGHRGPQLVALDQRRDEDQCQRDDEVGHDQAGGSPRWTRVRPGDEPGPPDHDQHRRDAGGGPGEVVGPVEVQRDRVDQQHDPQDRQRPEEPVLDLERRVGPESHPRQDACFSTAGGTCSPSSASLASRSSRFDSSLARPAYLSTYSWPESRMISYMISSVMLRRM